MSSALAVILQIANQSPGSYWSLARWTAQNPSCEILKLTASCDESDAHKSQSRWRQLVENIGAFIASIPPIIFVMHFVHEECCKLKELQDKCIAIEQNAVWKDFWSDIWELCQGGAQSIQFYQLLDKPDKQQDFEEALMRCWQTCKIFLESAKERCKLAEQRCRQEYFRPDLIHALKFLQEHPPSA